MEGIQSTMSAREPSGLPWAKVEEAFPFLFTWDSEMRIAQVGPSLARVAQDLVAGVPLSKVFKLERPQGEMNPEWLRKHRGMLMLLKHQSTGMQMRGQVMHLEESSLDVFLGSPWLNTSDELDRLGLALADFAPHDSAQDLLHVTQVHRMANEDLRMLNNRLKISQAKLVEREAESRKLAMVAERTNNAVILANHEGLIEWVNEAFQSMTGWTLSEVQGLKTGSFLQGPLTNPQVAKEMEVRLAEGTGFHTEILNYRKDGSTYWVDIEVQPIKDEKGSVTHFMAIEADVSGLKRNEMRRQLATAAAEVITSGTKLTGLIPKVLAALGGKLQAAVGSWWVRGIDGERLELAEIWQSDGAQAESFVQALREFSFSSDTGLPGRVWSSCTSHWITDVQKEAGYPGSPEASYCAITSIVALPVHVDGQVRGVLEFFSAHLDTPDPDLLATLNHIGLELGMMLKRMEAEAALVKSERAMNEGQRLAHLGTWEWDLTTNALTWSDEKFRIFGFKPRSFTPTLDHARRCVLADDLPRFLEVLESVIRTGERQEVSYRITRPSGEIRHVHTLAEAECDAENKPCRLVGTTQDLTEKIQTEEAYKHAQRISHLGNWTIDIASKAVRWSEEKYRIFGYEPGSVKVDLEFYQEAVHPDDFGAVMQFITTSAKTGQAMTINYRIVRPDGEMRHLRSNAEVSKDAHGNPREILGTVLDITELVQAQHTLQQTEERWQFALENNGLGVWDWNIITGYVLYTDRLQLMLGYEPSEWPQHVDSWTSKVHPEDLSLVMDKMNQCLAGVTPDYICEHRLRCKDGSWKWVQDVGRIVSYTKEGKPQRMIGTQMDINIRTQSEQAAKRRSELLNGIRAAQELFIGSSEMSPVFNSLLDVVVCHTQSNFGFIAEVLNDEKGDPYLRSYSLKNIAWNDETQSLMQKRGQQGLEFRNLKTLFGAALITKDVVIANHAASDPRSDGLPPEHRPIHSFLGLPVYNGLEMVGLIGLANRPDGYEKEGLKELDPFLAAVSSMIVARREAERRSQIEEKLRSARDKAEAASRTKSEFLTMISHEIRTPMNGIIGMSGLLKTNQIDAKQHEIVDAILHSGGALMNIIDDILNFAKIEAGQIELSEQPTVLEDLVEGVADLLYHEASSKGLELTTIISSDLPEVIFADAGRLRQVLLNLAGNAIKFTDKGHVAIRACVVDDTVEFRVEDSGIGIPELAHERLFKPFSQVDSSQSRRFGGTGLGLAICKKLVEAMNGFVGVVSQPGKGSEFWFRVPLHASIDQQIPILHQLRHVWIAHPSPRIRECIRMTLTTQGTVFHELKRVQVGQHLDTERAADEVLIVDTSWFSSSLKTKNAEQRQQAQMPLRKIVLIGPATQANRAVPTDSQMITIPLPLHRKALRQAVWPASAPIEEKSVTHHSLVLGLNILVAEDNRINARLACMLLENLGCKVEVACNGKEAFNAYLKGSFDAVLMDCQMPIMDGYAAARKIRQWEARRDKQSEQNPCKIIAMTASALPEDQLRCQASGMDDYLSKPFTVESLEHLLNTIVKKDGPTAALPFVKNPFAALSSQIGAGEARALAGMWLDEAARRRKRIISSLKRGQPEPACKEIHTLRGASTVFGMNALVATLVTMETELRKGAVVSSSLLHEFETRLALEIDKIHQWMNAVQT
ncbi:PAS domain-containing protein [Prosthecobacter sp.]